MPQRIQGLDGLRALSIALVIVGHAYQGATGTSPHSPIWLIFGNAGLGVSIFFVISGFLITTLLLNEHGKFGKISLRHFYVRRAFRILPALFTYLLVIAAMTSIGMLNDVTRDSILSAIFFVTNYSPWPISPALEHTWSLSVEEQFYLIWPAMLAILLYQGKRHAAAWLAFILVTIAPAIRILTAMSDNEFLRSHIYFMLHTRMDALMFGCLLALLVGTIRFEQFYRNACRFVVPAALFTLLVSPLATAKFGGKYIYIIGYSIEGASIALVILWVTRNPHAWAGQILNSKPIVRVGVISYSLYLWQELFLKSNLPVGNYTWLAILLSALAAEASYRLIEQPFLRLRLRRGWGMPSLKPAAT